MEWEPLQANINFCPFCGAPLEINEDTIHQGKTCSAHPANCDVVWLNTGRDIQGHFAIQGLMYGS